jgi:hypothetical protein
VLDGRDGIAAPDSPVSKHVSVTAAARQSWGYTTNIKRSSLCGINENMPSQSKNGETHSTVALHRREFSLSLPASFAPSGK